MDSRILDVMSDRRIELGPHATNTATPVGSWKHFKLARDAEGVAWLLFDRAGASANTLSAEVLEELDNVLNVVESDRPTGLVIRSAKSSGFIAGADVNEFRGATDPLAGRKCDGARACSDRPHRESWHTDDRGDPRLLPRRRPRDRAGLQVSHRDRRCALRLSGSDARPASRASAAPRVSPTSSARSKR